MALLTDREAVKAFCEPLRGAGHIAVDTEFMRESTYWPRLCLVQIAGPGKGDENAAAIDALANGMDLEPVFALMRDPNILKVFHAARQDMEIFYNLMGEMPAPVFDTQIAGMVCGFGDSASYETLVNRLVQKSIDKSSRFTDWSLRPLSEKQISYALSDVTHLRVIYEKLAERLDSKGRGDWVEAEMKSMAEPADYVTNPMLAYQRIKIRNPTSRVLAILREVAAWREKAAQDIDIPRNRMLRDEALVEIAHHAPKDTRALSRIRGLSAKQAEGWQGRQLLEAVKRGGELPDADCPAPPEKRNLPRGLGPITDMLKVLLKMRSDDSNVAQRLIASSADIDEIAAFGEKAEAPAMSGWRREVFGDDALRIRSGDVALAVEGKRVVLVEWEPVDGDE